MDRFLVLFFCLFNVLNSSAQDIRFDVNGIYDKPVTQTQLLSAENLKDINPGFPASWIQSYESVQLMIINGVDTIITRSKDDNLSSEQKALLSTLKMGAKVAAHVKYYPISNSLDGKIKNTYFSYTVVPETEAEFEGGYKGFKDYLNAKAINKINALVHKDTKTAIIKFTINEDGDTVDAHIAETSNNEKIDQLLLKAICNMPKWKPAMNRNGKKIPQEFSFRAGSEVGC